MSTGQDQSKSDNVFSLEPRGRATAKIDRIEAYWNSIRGKRLVPSRSEIDPRGLDGMLGNAFILERITGGLARFRIAGSRLVDLTGLELRQMPISALFLPKARDALSDALQAVFDAPAVVRLAITSPGGAGHETLHGELILLPLRSDLGDVDRVLGAIVFDGKIGRTPRRLEIADQSRKSLTGFAGPLQQATTPTETAGETADPSPFASVRRRSRRPLPEERSHLRLVISNT